MDKTIEKKLLDYLVVDEANRNTPGIVDNFLSFLSTEDKFLNAWMRLTFADILTKHIEQLGEVLNRCESPIEKVLVIALNVCAYEANVEETIWNIYGTKKNKERRVCNQLIIEPQAVVGKYRVDFKLTWDSSEPDWDNCTTQPDGYRMPGYKEIHREVYVECDGHDFHERTKEQAAHDRKKDRTLQAAGFNILRFTGAEIWRDPVKCAEEIYAYLQSDRPTKTKDELQ